jgi:hypothetical protein
VIVPVIVVAVLTLSADPVVEGPDGPVAPAGPAGPAEPVVPLQAASSMQSSTAPLKLAVADAKCNPRNVVVPSISQHLPRFANESGDKRAQLRRGA